MEFIFIRLKEQQWAQNLQLFGNDLVVAYEEVKMFALLPQQYPQDFVGFFMRNYFRFLDDVFHKLLDNFDILTLNLFIA